MDKVIKWLGIINLFLWTGLLISVITANYDANTLKEFAEGAIFVVAVDTGLDLLGNRKERNSEKVK